MNDSREHNIEKTKQLVDYLLYETNYVNFEICK